MLGGQRNAQNTMVEKFLKRRVPPNESSSNKKRTDNGICKSFAGKLSRVIKESKEGQRNYAKQNHEKIISKKAIYTHFQATQATPKGCIKIGKRKEWQTQ